MPASLLIKISHSVQPPHSLNRARCPSMYQITPKKKVGRGPHFGIAMQAALWEEGESKRHPRRRDRLETLFHEADQPAGRALAGGGEAARTPYGRATAPDRRRVQRGLSSSAAYAFSTCRSRSCAPGRAGRRPQAMDGAARRAVAAEIIPAHQRSDLGEPGWVVA
jgi:hypothetical protein